MTDETIALSPVSSREEGVLLENLLELYIHDLSALFAEVRLGSDGRFGYPDLPSYLSGSRDKLPFLIRCDGRVAGFVLVRRGSPVSKDPDVLDIAEYFVLRQFRGRGVGRAAAQLLWDTLRGSWTIRAATVNPGAVAFWRSVVSTYTSNTAGESERRDGAKHWIVFAFDNAR